MIRVIAYAISTGIYLQCWRLITAPESARLCLQVGPIVDDIAPKATRAKLRKKLSNAKTSLLAQGSRVLKKLPPRLAFPKKKQARNSSAPTADRPPHSAQSAHSADDAPSGDTSRRSMAASCAVEAARHTSPAAPSQGANGTLPSCALEAGSRPWLALKSHNWRISPGAFPSAGVPAAPASDAEDTGANGSAFAIEAARRSGGGWRGAGGLVQHASRGGTLEPSGPQRELDQIAELTAPWEILVLTPKLLRQAVDALGAELTEALEASAQLSRDFTAGSVAEGGLGYGGVAGECACRWDREWWERAGSGRLCWCGIQEVVSEVYGGTA